MLVGLGYVPGDFSKSPIAQQFVAQNPVLTSGAARAVANIAPSATGAAPSVSQQKAYVMRKDLPAATTDMLLSMPLWKKAAIALAIAVPVGYLGYRFVKSRKQAKASVSA